MDVLKVLWGMSRGPPLLNGDGGDRRDMCQVEMEVSVTTSAAGICCTCEIAFAVSHPATCLVRIMEIVCNVYGQYKSELREKKTKTPCLSDAAPFTVTLYTSIPLALILFERVHCHQTTHNYGF